MELYVTILTANDGYDKPKCYVGKTKEEIKSQIFSDLFDNDESMIEEFNDEVVECIEEGSIYTEFTEFPCSSVTYKKEI